jgi:hypothetical protein
VDCTTGDVRQAREYLADGTAAVTDLEYLANGNLRSVTGPANKTGQRYRLDYGYDTVVGIHIESIVDSFGYRSATTHNFKYGEPELTTDQNNQRMRMAYDSPRPGRARGLLWSTTATTPPAPPTTTSAAERWWTARTRAAPRPATTSRAM